VSVAQSDVRWAAVPPTLTSMDPTQALPPAPELEELDVPVDVDPPVPELLELELPGPPDVDMLEPELVEPVLAEPELVVPELVVPELVVPPPPSLATLPPQAMSRRRGREAAT
jgi:fused signal recognition particle receptor